MDDININKICLDIEEVQLDGDEEDWVKLSWISSQTDNDGNFQSPETPRDSDNEIVQMKNDEKVLNVEPEDVSDGISVITESDTDVNTAIFQISQFSCKPLQMVDMQKDIWNISVLAACALGIVIGMALSHFFMIPETCSVSDKVDAENLKTASHNIVNTCKELTDLKTMLNEIKTHMPTDRKPMELFLTEQFFEFADSSNKTNSKPIVVTKEFFNSTLHPLDQLQVSLRVLSSLTFIYDDNNSLKNDVNKTLDIINNTKAFYDALVLFANNTQDVLDPVVLNFLQYNSNKMHIISKSLLSNLAEKVSKITSKVYHKYSNERHKLNKKLCHLKSVLSDDKLLKQLTENNQLFKDYNKTCISNNTSKNSDDTTTKKGNTKTKEYIRKTDDTVSHPTYDNKNSHKIHNNKENSMKNKENKKQNVDKSTAMKFLQNTSHKIRNTSQLLLSKVVEDMNKLRHQLNKKLHHLKNMLPNNNEFLKQLIWDDKEDNKKSEKSEKKDDYLQSNVISKDSTSKNNFDNILMQLKNTCPLSTNYCPKFNINVSTFDTVPNYKTKNYRHRKYDTKYDTKYNSKKTAMDYENSPKILSTEGKSKSKKKDHFKSNGSTKKATDDKANYEGKNISSKNKIKNHISEHTDNYHKSKHSSFDSRTVKQNNQYYTNTDRRSDNKRSYEYKERRHSDDSDWYFRRAYARGNARHLDDSDWYFQRAHSRKNARRHAEYM